MLSPHGESRGAWPLGGQKASRREVGGRPLRLKGRWYKGCRGARPPERARLWAWPSTASWCRVTSLWGTRVGWGLQKV